MIKLKCLRKCDLLACFSRNNLFLKLRSRRVSNDVMGHDRDQTLLRVCNVLKGSLCRAVMVTGRGAQLCLQWGQSCVHSCPGKSDPCSESDKEQVLIACVFYTVVDLLIVT